MHLTSSNFGSYPMANGLSRIATRFYGDGDSLKNAHGLLNRPLLAQDALEAGLLTFAPDDIDWDDEVRLLLEESSNLSPDALTGMEANLRFPGPETMETKIFARLTAWQNWIFQRPNAVSDTGALRTYGTGKRAQFDRKRV
jgi:benzoyl-CoA-dihydrodiol lyase